MTTNMTKNSFSSAFLVSLSFLTQLQVVRPRLGQSIPKIYASFVIIASPSSWSTMVNTRTCSLPSSGEAPFLMNAFQPAKRTENCRKMAGTSYGGKPQPRFDCDTKCKQTVKGAWLFARVAQLCNTQLPVVFVAILVMPNGIYWFQV